MKKVVLIMFALICFGATANAQTASGYCSLPGGEDYVNVDYYNDGHLAVSINTEKTVTNLLITVTCTETWVDIEQVQDGYDTYGRPRMVNKQKPQEKTYTLCNQTYYEDKLQSNRTNTIKEGVKPNHELNNHRYKYTVKVSNPRCK